MVVFHLDIESFMTTVACLKEHRFRGRPLVIALPVPRAVVLAASPEAKKLCIHKGDSVAQISRYRQKVEIIPPNYPLYHAAGRYILKLAGAFSPTIEPLKFGHIALDMSGTQKLYNGLHNAAYNLRKEIKSRTGLNATVGIAGNKLVSTIAAKETQIHQEPLYRVNEGDEPGFLAPLPCRALPDWENRAVQKLLFELNMKTIDKIQGVSRDVFSYTLGKMAGRLHRHAFGIDPSPVTPPESVRSLNKSYLFSPDTNDDGELLNTLKNLTEQLCYQLRTKSLASDRAQLHIRYSDGIERKGQYLYNRTQQENNIYRILRKNFHQLCDRRQRVRFLKLSLLGLCRHFCQGELFPDLFQENKRRSLDAGLDKIRGKFGLSSIHRGLPNRAVFQKQFVV